MYTLINAVLINYWMGRKRKKMVGRETDKMERTV